ncbi:MAG: MFS transporter [Desulfobacteraceae bacterium]|nr:MFS transporter [Desulfobacteraceae bacterium]
MMDGATKPLLRDRRYWPLFWTQFLGAFNDNVLKNALVILIAFKEHTLWFFSSSQMVALCAGIFILPFFLFSATAGQLADKYSKPRIVFWIKVAEIVIAGTGAYGFVRDEIGFLLAALFLMGFHSTFFGPVKYSILPQLLRQEELVSGTAFVEMGTFVAILLGTLLGGILIAVQGTGPWLVGMAVLALAALGCVASTRIVPLPPVAPSLRIPADPVRPTVEIVKLVAKNRSVFLAVLGISWFWCLGAACLSLLPPYCKEFLNAEELVVTLFLALFSVGVGTGSLLCGSLSFKKLELGLVPPGALGLSLFALDLFLAGRPESLAVHAGGQVTVPMLLSTAGGWRLVMDFFFFSVAGGFFIVPLYTGMQQRSDERERSRVVAGNNILNALAMVLSALMLIGLFHLNFTIPRIFLILAVMNAAAASCIFAADGEFLSRCICWTYAHIMRRVGVVGAGNIPAEGPALLACSLCTPRDWMLLASSWGRPVHFVTPDGRFGVPSVGGLPGKIPRRRSAEWNREEVEGLAARALEITGKGGVVCVLREKERNGAEESAGWLRWIGEIARKGGLPVIPVSVDCPDARDRREEGVESPEGFFKGLGSRRLMAFGEGIAACEFSGGRLLESFEKLGARR